MSVTEIKKPLKSFTGIAFQRFIAVGLRGFEPRQTESKSVVLPLYYRPILIPIITVWGVQK